MASSSSSEADEDLSKGDSKANTVESAEYYDELKISYSSGDGVKRSEQGFWGFLSAEQEASLREARRRCDEEGIDLRFLSTHSLAWQLTLLRFLRGHKWVIDDCINGIKEGIEWREEMDVSNVRKMTAADVLGVPFRTLHDIYHHWHCGYDKVGRPVIYRSYRTFDATKILAQVSLKQVQQYFAWEQEIHMAITKEASERLGYIVETTVSVLDLEGMRLSQVNNQFLQLVRMSADVGKVHYPETLGKLYIINAPSAFSFVWRIVKGWLDPDVVSKIDIISNKKDWSKALDDLIGMEGIPSNFGGSLPEMDTRQHAYFGILQHLGIPIADEYYEEKKRLDRLMKEEHERRNSFNSLEEEEHLDRTTFRRKDSIARRRSSGEGPSKRPSGDGEDTWKDNEGFVGKEPRFRRGIVGGLSRWWGGGGGGGGGEAAGGHWEKEVYGGVDKYDSDGSDGSDSVDSSHFSDAFDCAESASSYGENAARDRGHTHRRHSSYYSRGLHRNSPNGLEAQADDEDNNSDPGTHAKLSLHSLCKGRRMWSRYPTTTLAKLLERVIFIFIFFHVVILVLCTYLFTSPDWLGLANYQWTNIVSLFLALLGICVNFLGWVGLRASNAPLLSLFSSGVILMQLLYVVTAVSSFIYASDIAVKDSSSIIYVENMQSYNAGIGAAATFLLLVSVVPVTLGFTMVSRMRRRSPNVGLKRQETEMGSILTLTNALTVLAGIGMVILGAAGLDTLLEEFREKGTEMADLVAFSLYLIVIVAVFIILSAIMGLWAATSAHRSVVRAYYLVILPLGMVFLIATAVQSFWTTALRSGTGDGGGWNVLLLVSGVYLVFMALFQLFSATAARFRSLVMLRQRELEVMNGDQRIKATTKDIGSGKKKSDHRVKLTFGLKMLRAGTDKASLEGDMGVRLAGKNHIVRKRTAMDRFFIGYGVLLGCFQIFYSITSVMYTSLVSHNAVFGVFGALFDLIAQADARYTGDTGDTYLIALFVISGTVSGPGLLLYAWSTFVRASWRHVTGVSVGILLLFCQILYYAGTDTPVDDSNVTVFALLMLLPSIIFNVFIPSYLLWREVRASVRSAQRSENIDLYLEMKSQTKEDADLERGRVSSFDDNISPRSAPGRIGGSISPSNLTRTQVQKIDEEIDEESQPARDPATKASSIDGVTEEDHEERPALSAIGDSYSVYGDAASAGATTSGLTNELSRSGSSESLPTLGSSGHGLRRPIQSRSNTGTPVAIHSALPSYQDDNEWKFSPGVTGAQPRSTSRSPAATSVANDSDISHTDDGTTGMKKIQSEASFARGAFESFRRSRQKRTSSDDTAVLSKLTARKQQSGRSRSKTSREIDVPSPQSDRVASKAEAAQFLKTLQDLDYLDQDSMII